MQDFYSCFISRPICKSSNKCTGVCLCKFFKGEKWIERKMRLLHDIGNILHTSRWIRSTLMTPNYYGRLYIHCQYSLRWPTFMISGWSANHVTSRSLVDLDTYQLTGLWHLTSDDIHLWQIRRQHTKHTVVKKWGFEHNVARDCFILV